MRLALTGATIISSISPPSVATADILVEHGRVAAVGVPVPDGIARLDCSGCLVVPGNVCAHPPVLSARARNARCGTCAAVVHRDPPPSLVAT